MFQRHIFGKNIHYSGVEMEYLFHILYSKDSNLLHCVGIFRVHPGILEVSLVSSSRSGNVATTSGCQKMLVSRIFAYFSTNWRQWYFKLRRICRWCIRWGLLRKFLIYAAWVLRPFVRVSVWVFQMALRQNFMVNSLTMRFSTKICLVALLDAILSISD